jgi:pathogenesis-related protein 1
MQLRIARTGLVIFLSCFTLASVAFGFVQGEWHHFVEASDESNSMPREIVREHNLVRQRFGCPPLRWSRDLARSAQTWANRLAEQRAFQHETSMSYGQNLFEIRGGIATPAQVVNAWAGEEKYYDKSRNSCSGVCGHFTQIVWRNTTEVGCGAARDRDRQVWVCDYSPPGNFVGERPF